MQKPLVMNDSAQMAHSAAHLRAVAVKADGGEGRGAGICAQRGGAAGAAPRGIGADSNVPRQVSAAAASTCQQ
jgi:hypothetical protein